MRWRIRKAACAFELSLPRLGREMGQSFLRSAFAKSYTAKASRAF